MPSVAVVVSSEPIDWLQLHGSQEFPLAALLCQAQQQLQQQLRLAKPMESWPPSRIHLSCQWQPNAIDSRCRKYARYCIVMQTRRPNKPLGSKARRPSSGAQVRLGGHTSSHVSVAYEFVYLLGRRRSQQAAIHTRLLRKSQWQPSRRDQLGIDNRSDRIVADDLAPKQTTARLDSDDCARLDQSECLDALQAAPFRLVGQS